MDDKQLFETLNQIKKEILEQVEFYHEDTNKKFDRLFTAHDQHKVDISEIKTHLQYTKEKFEEMKGVIEKEVSLLWKELGNQKSELIHIIDQAVTSSRDSYKSDLTSYQKLYDSKLEGLVADLKAVDSELQIASQLSTGRFWKAIALSLISAIIALTGHALVRILIQ